jgi:hypothetical protein
VPNLDEIAAQLASAPPREFTRERKALVTRLTKSGQTAAAARVKAMPRPTVPVWAVNRLARDEPKSIDRLITSVQQMRAAQLGGGKPHELSAASQSYRALLAHLSERAEAILREAGLGATHQVRLRVETTLAAAAVDPKLRPMLREGRLERELAARGFEVFAGEKLPPKARIPAAAPGPSVSRAATGESTAAERGASDRESRRARVREAHSQAQAQAAAQRERLAAARRRVTELQNLLREATRAQAEAAENDKRAARTLRATERALRAAEHARARATPKWRQ